MLPNILKRLSCALCMREVVLVVQGDMRDGRQKLEEAMKEGWREEGFFALCPTHAATDLSEIDRLHVLARARAAAMAAHYGFQFSVRDGQVHRGDDVRRATVEEMELWAALARRMPSR
jgi:hypothetical protein